MCDHLFLQEKVQEMTVFCNATCFLSTNSLSVLDPENTLTLNVDLFMFSVCVSSLKRFDGETYFIFMCNLTDHVFVPISRQNALGVPINAKKNFDVASYEALLLKFTCWVGARQCRRNKQTPLHRHSGQKNANLRQLN